MGNTEDGKKRIITKTNHFQFSLYLQSRINLKELFLLNQDNHFYIDDRNNSEAVFYEITDENLPKELSELECGSDLFHLLPSGMRTIMNEKELIDLLPNPASNKRPQAITDKISIKLSGIDFFNSEKSPIKIVSVDIYNPDEHDYIICPTQYGKEDILVKTNPYVLFLFLHNRLSVSEVFKCRMDDFYLIHDGNSFYLSKYNSYVESLIQNFGQLNQTYYSLPPNMRIENPIELYSFYTRNHTISGKGIIEPGFRKKYPIELKIVGR